MCFEGSSLHIYIPPNARDLYTYHQVIIIIHKIASRQKQMIGKLMDMTKIWVEASLFRCFLYFFHLFFSSPPPFLCRLEFISNQRASRELQLLITYSFAFLHINDCRVLVGFLPQWFKGTSVLCSPGKRRDGQRQGSKPVQSPLYRS